MIFLLWAVGAIVCREISLCSSVKAEEHGSVKYSIKYYMIGFSSTLLFAFVSQNVGPGHLRQYPSNPAMVMKSIISMNSNGMISRNQLTTINQSQLNAQLSLNMAGPNITHTSPSPPASKSATPSPSSSINEDDQDDGNRVRKGT